MTMKTVASVGLALSLFAITMTGASARTRHQTESIPAFDRHAINGMSVELSPARSTHKVRIAGLKQVRHKRKLRAASSQRVVRVDHSEHRTSAATEFVPHPSGCPARAFCGCGASIEVFGRSIRELWLAANWFAFPRTSPAPGMVAVRRHHVFVIREVRGPGLVLAYDPNSGHGKTRVHLRSLAGFTVVNPHGNARYASAR